MGWGLEKSQMEHDKTTIFKGNICINVTGTTDSGNAVSALLFLFEFTVTAIIVFSVSDYKQFNVYILLKTF